MAKEIEKLADCKLLYAHIWIDLGKLFKIPEQGGFRMDLLQRIKGLVIPKLEHLLEDWNITKLAEKIVHSPARNVETNANGPLERDPSCKRKSTCRICPDTMSGAYLESGVIPLSLINFALLGE